MKNEETIKEAANRKAKDYLYRRIKALCHNMEHSRYKNATEIIDLLRKIAQSTEDAHLLYFEED